MQLKFKTRLLIAAAIAAGNATAIDLGGALNSGVTAAKGMSLSDDDIKAISDQACTEQDKTNKIAPPGSKYAARLAKLTQGLTSEDGISLNFKVYLTPSVNAWAMANGCVRVYSGLMDIASDDEIRSVVGHEIGHAKLGHTKAKMKTAYMTRAAHQAAAASGGKVGAIASSELGAVAEAFINAQFSQKEESEADVYGYHFMVKHHYDPHAMVTILRKLPPGGGLMSSHPSSPDRAAKIESLIIKKG
jgi:putative metalloprotease